MTHHLQMITFRNRTCARSWSPTYRAVASFQVGSEGGFVHTLDIPNAPNSVLNINKKENWNNQKWWKIRNGHARSCKHVTIGFISTKGKQNKRPTSNRKKWATNSQSVHKNEPVPLSSGRHKKQCMSAGLQQISRSTWWVDTCRCIVASSKPPFLKISLPLVWPQCSWPTPTSPYVVIFVLVLHAIAMLLYPVFTLLCVHPSTPHLLLSLMRGACISNSALNLKKMVQFRGTQGHEETVIQHRIQLYWF